MNYGSIFAGAGLLDLGLRQVLPGLRCAFAVESDADRAALFQTHVGAGVAYADIASVPDDLPRVIGLVGGVPCSTHSTANTAGIRQLAPEWRHALRIIDATRPVWTLWESSDKDRAWQRWVPAVRCDLHERRHASVCFRLRTAGRGAPHERERAFVLSWDRAVEPDCQGQPTGAVHAEVARLRAAAVAVWDGRVPTRAHGRLDDGVDRRVARAVGLGVDQRSAVDAGRVLAAMLGGLGLMAE